MDCLRCGSSYPADANFCVECGLRLSVVCRLCWNRNEPGKLYCSRCGHALTTVRSSVQLSKDVSLGTEYAIGPMPSSAALEGERKQVTVLFCDIVDSTRRAAEIGPEPMHLFLNQFFALGLSEVHRFEGVINNLLGDGFMALFGAPQAHEDHARDAVLAAMAIQKRLLVEKLGKEHRLGPATVRMGVNTGPVVVGAVGDTQNYTADGETTHLAFRFQQHAEPGSILVGEATKNLVAGYIRVEPHVPILLKHIELPVTVFKVLALGGRRSRIDPLAGPPETTFVGRDCELKALLEALGNAERESGQVVGLSAEAGVGKSRLLFEFRQRISPRRIDYLEAHCASHGKATPYFALQDIIRNLCSINLNDPESEVKDKIKNLLRDVEALADDQWPLLFQILNIANADPGHHSSPSVQSTKAVIFHLLQKIVLAKSRRRPLILAIEDIHWIDQLSEEFLASLAATIVASPVLLIMTYRQQHRPTWLSYSHSTEICLNQLSTEHATKIVEENAKQTPFLDSTTKAIVERAAGNPFFLEELTKAVVERRGAENDVPIPDTIQDVLMARIDLLPFGTKRVLQTASVLGPKFEAGLLSSMSDDEEAGEIGAHLSRLVGSGFLIKDLGVETSYQFRHALTQEVAYTSLLVSRRRAIHEKAGLALEQIYQAGPVSIKEEHQATSASSVDLMAYHFSRSPNHEKELRYKQIAGGLAIRKGAYVDAHRYLARALEIVSAMPASHERDAHELALLLTAGTVLLVIRGQGSLEAREIYDRALGLCSTIPEGPELGRALFGIWTYYLFHGLMRDAEAAVQKIVRLADKAEDPDVKIMAQLAAAQTYLWMGDWRQCLVHTAAVDALYSPEKHANYITQYAQNPRFTALGCHFWANWALGFSDKAAKMISAAIIEAADLNHDFTFVMAYLCKPLLFYFQRRTKDLAESISEFVSAAEKAGNPFYISLARVMEASTKIAGGSKQEGLQQLVEQRKQMQAAGLYLAEPLVVTVLAQVLLDIGRCDEGLALLDEACEIFIANGQCSCLAEMMRLRGELLIASVDDHTELNAKEVEVCFRKAIQIASSQSAKTLELRAALGLARFLIRLGRKKEGQQLLTPLCFWFSEGLDTPDIIEARRLLGSLS
jgi:predicted ATPase/class 3 adenylate cyclase